MFANRLSKEALKLIEDMMQVAEYDDNSLVSNFNISLLWIPHFVLITYNAGVYLLLAYCYRN